MALETLVPLRRTADDAGTPADALPACRRHRVAPEPDRRARQERHHVVTVEVAVGEREQAEQGTPEHALGERADCRAVVWDAGGLELFVHETRVGLGGAVEDRHPFERYTVHQCGHHEPYGRAYFVVGIRRRDHLGAVGWLQRTLAAAGELETEPCDHGGDPGIGALDTGDAGDDREWRVLGDRTQQRRAGQRQVLRQVQHDRAQVGEDRAAFPDRADGGVHQVALVVPGTRERGAGRAVDAYDVGGASAGAREPVERGVVALRQLAVGVDQRLFGRRVLRDAGEHARLAREHAAHRGAEHGR